MRHCNNSRMGVEALEDRRLLAASFSPVLQVGRWDAQLSQHVFGDVTFDSQGDVVVGAKTEWGPLDLDPRRHHTFLVDGYREVALAKYNSAGRLTWARRFNVAVGQPVSDALGNCYVVGSTSGSVQFSRKDLADDFSVTTESKFVMKINAKGWVLWAKVLDQAALGDSGFVPEDIFDMAVDRGGNVMLTGRFHRTLNNSTFPIAYAIQLDADGRVLWANEIGQGMGWRVALDTRGRAYVAIDRYPVGGSYQVESPVVTGALAKLSSAGKVVWRKEIVGDGTAIPNALGVDREGHAYIASKFQGLIDADPGPREIFFKSATASATETLVQKFDSDGTLEWARPTRRTGGTASRKATYTVPANLVIQPSGGVMVAGSSNVPTDFDPGAGTQINDPGAGGVDTFVWSLDHSGKFQSLSKISMPGVSYTGVTVGRSDAGRISVALRGPISMEEQAALQVWAG